MAGGLKFDSEKADLSLVPQVAMEQEALAFMVGEKKYARYNFCEGMESHRLVAAALRHILAWQRGEDNDPESTELLGRPVSHLGNARACLAMLLETQRLGTLEDTRYKPTPKPTLIKDSSDDDQNTERK